MFLALLLSSFGGDAFSSDEEEAVKKPKVSRIKRIMRWIRKKRRKKEGRVHSADVRNAAYTNNDSTNQMVRPLIFFLYKGAVGVNGKVVAYDSTNGF